MIAIRPVEQFDCVVFGATGDLTLRKLLPALYYRRRDQQFPPQSRIIAAARSELTDETYRDKAREALHHFVNAEDLDEDILKAFLQQVHYVRVNGKTGEGFDALKTLLDTDAAPVRVFYMATAPGLFGPTCRHLGEHGLVTDQSRVVLEKPIGTDLASAQAINDEVGEYFTEAQIYRIDHYLGKETVQNLMALRFANTIFERVWNSDVIDHVQITVAETVGVEDRAEYYDRSGAMRDMVQNHLLQLLCMVAMEAPGSLDADAVRDEKLKVLRALKPIDPHDIPHATVRGQYADGMVDGKPVTSYHKDLGQEDDSDLDNDQVSRTETFVALKAEIQNWRWAGVPFYLRTGKRMPRKVSEIVIQFRAVPFTLFPPESGELQPCRLVVRLQPREGMRLEIMSKAPLPGGLHLRPVGLDISFAEVFRTRYPDAYEQLLMDTVRGNPTLFMRRDEVEAAWSWVEPILQAWNTRVEAPRPYHGGSWGPSASITLIERDGRTWHEDMS